MIRYILLDIEGTTTDINFVHKVLFPYSQQHLKPFLRENANTPEVQDCLAQVQKTVLDEEGRTLSAEEAIQVLMHWIMSDRKHGALKILQGLIWEDGFKNGTFKGHVYEDVPRCLEQWRNAGIKLAIYSSGSVHAQKLLFGYSEYGDLMPFFSAQFDTAVGGKKEANSYATIAKQLSVASDDILFLSDVGDELFAAQQAGLKVLQSCRPGIKPDPRFTQIHDFYAVSPYLGTQQSQLSSGKLV